MKESDRGAIPLAAHPAAGAREDAWVWGWDETPGIVSVWAEATGRAHVWRRDPESRELTHETASFRPWMLLADTYGLDADDSARSRGVQIRELGVSAGDAAPLRGIVPRPAASGHVPLRWHVSAPDQHTLTNIVFAAASQRLGIRVTSTRELDDASGGDVSLLLPPDEQYLVATGRTYFRGLDFDGIHRLQFDLETTGLDPETSRMFMVAVLEPDGTRYTLEADDDSDAAEARLIANLVARVAAVDPDVIENHNLHGFDLAFLERRARQHRVRLALGRLPSLGLLQRAARSGTRAEYDETRRIRYVAPGRELIDTLDAVRRYDFAVRDMPSYGLKAVAKHLGIAGPDREYIRGDRIHATFKTDPERVRRYAIDDVEEVERLSRIIGGSAFALARMAPRRYERLADAGPATGVIDPMLVRAYLHENTALPAHEEGDGTVHSGGALHLFATGVAVRVVKADVASLYPSLMRQYRIGPARDSLGALLAIVDRMTTLRLDAKSAARDGSRATRDRSMADATSGAMKIVINSAYGYMGAGGALVRFADVHAANEVTRRGRETLALLCNAFAERGVTLLEADTDGVYFAVPAGWSETEERAVVAEVGALLPPLIKLEFEGRYAAMLSHEPKNYALLGYDGRLMVRGVAFRSSRAEPYGDAFLRDALRSLLSGDIVAVRTGYVETLDALRARRTPTYDVSSKTRLTKSPEQYAESRESRRELAYEAMIASGRERWRVGERARVYRTSGGGGNTVAEREDGSVAGTSANDSREYDVEYYARQLRDTYAARLQRAFTAADWETLFADPAQPSLFAPVIETIRPILTPVESPPPAPASAW